MAATRPLKQRNCTDWRPLCWLWQWRSCWTLHQVSVHFPLHWHKKNQQVQHSVYIQFTLRMSLWLLCLFLRESLYCMHVYTLSPMSGYLIVATTTRGGKSRKDWQTTISPQTSTWMGYCYQFVLLGKFPTHRKSHDWVQVYEVNYLTSLAPCTAMM